MPIILFTIACIVAGCAEEEFPVSVTAKDLKTGKGIAFAKIDLDGKPLGLTDQSGNFSEFVKVEKDQSSDKLMWISPMQTVQNLPHHL